MESVHLLTEFVAFGGLPFGIRTHLVATAIVQSSTVIELSTRAGQLFRGSQPVNEFLEKLCQKEVQKPTMARWTLYTCHFGDINRHHVVQ